MASDLECQLEVDENFQLEGELKDVKDYRLRLIMIKLESLKKNSQFETVLKNRVINNELFTIYKSKNFTKNTSDLKKLYISFVMRKKIGNAVKRNRIRRKLKAIIIKMLKIKGAINLNYTYIVFGKTKAYFAKHDELFEEMVKGFKKI